MTKNAARVLVHLEMHGPQTMNDLLALPRLSVATLNLVLAELLETGRIERCPIGQSGGVRVKTKERLD